MSQGPSSDAPLVEVEGLVKHFALGGGAFGGMASQFVRAVDGISFTIARGETLGLVGESGCGKTTTGRLLLRLVEPTAGTVRLEGTDVATLSGRALRALRQRAQIIFQDPYGSLNPRMTVADIVAEPIRIHRADRGAARIRRVHELLDLVGLAPHHANRYPHEFSGGQRQRIGIARALALHPSFIVCDEPVSALDVSVQAQIINLMQDLREQLGLTYLFISHDLGVVRHISSRVAVMYLGRIVEVADRRELFDRPRHPYTRALLDAVPVVPGSGARGARAHHPLGGDVPSPISPPAGCHFHPRCPLAEDRCRERYPGFAEVALGHGVACHLVPGTPAAPAIASGAPADGAGASS